MEFFLTDIIGKGGSDLSLYIVAFISVAIIFLQIFLSTRQARVLGQIKEIVRLEEERLEVEKKHLEVSEDIRDIVRAEHESTI